MEKVKRAYTKNEEIFNAVSHGVGALASIIGATVLVTLAVCFAGPRAVFASAVYGLSLVLLYTMSTLYHAFPYAGVKKVFRVFDHSTIYLLIAGSYTPFCLITLNGNRKGDLIFISLWAVSAIGILCNAISVERFRHLSLALYVLTGWAALFAIGDIAAALPGPGLWLLVAGGVSYTAGIGFYVAKSKPYTHCIWHLFVLAGSVLHYWCIAAYVLPAACSSFA